MTISTPGTSQLSCGDWAVLGLLAEQPRHGFAVARLMAPEGEIGRVWALPKPLVYRALSTLQDRGMVTPMGEEPGERGPHRTLHGATAEGVEALGAWLATPVDHLREVRSLLMLKLALLARGGADPAALLAAQRERLGPVVAALEARVGTAKAFDRTLLLWRLESARAVLNFIDGVSATAPVAAGPREG
ncbi:MAG TPA: helix-turn-helix transcriptional regulator [Candidatus Dormibacteraeota bacterium]|nr:helix-turn-helix transcriptional regulator [Candidatus Dormibacteraeota bacterium]